MNQNNNQVQQSSQVSQEELAKTQVLNLNDVKELAKFERRTSKKPAILLAIAGLLSISLGFSYPNIMTALDKASTTETKEEKKQEEVLNKVQENIQECKYLSGANADGTSGTVTYSLLYNENDQLQSYTMVLTIDPQTGSANGLVATQNVYNSYKALDAIALTGYTMATSYTDTGMKAIANVDLAKFNKATLTAAHNSNYFAQVPFNYGDTKTTIEQNLTSGGYICK